MDKYKHQLKWIEYDLQLSIKPGTPIETKLARLTNSLAGILRLLEQLTTVEPTQTAITAEGTSAAAGFTIPTTQPSLQSDPVDTGSGLAGLHSVCAHVHRRMFYLNEAEDNPYRALWAWEWCPISAEPVLKSSVKTPAQGVDTISSTSVKQPSKESVENSVEESAKSQWKPNNFDEVCRVAVLQDSHCILKVGHPGQHIDRFGETPLDMSSERMGYR